MRLPIDLAAPQTVDDTGDPFLILALDHQHVVVRVGGADSGPEPDGADDVRVLMIDYINQAIQDLDGPSVDILRNAGPFVSYQLIAGEDSFAMIREGERDRTGDQRFAQWLSIDADGRVTDVLLPADPIGRRPQRVIALDNAAILVDASDSATPDRIDRVTLYRAGGTATFDVRSLDTAFASLADRFDARDVDQSGAVEPLDALRLINALRRRDDAIPPSNLDINGDGEFTPLDALLVINYLRRQSLPSTLTGESTWLSTPPVGAVDRSHSDSGFLDEIILDEMIDEIDETERIRRTRPVGG